MKYILIFLATFSSIIFSQQKSEFRAVWLTNVDSYVLGTDDNIVEAMDYLASINVNVVFPVVYNKGYTLYPSAVMDSLFGEPVLPNSEFVNRDFLERIVIEAHRNGIEVIPWFEFGFSSSYSQNGGHIVQKFPEWAAKDKTGKLLVKNGFDWLSGTNPEVQDYMLSLILEVIDKYDVDGVQGDDRLPAMPVEGGYDAVTVELYKSEHNGNNPPTNNSDTQWMKWRADKLTDYLERMRDSIKSRNENLILSVSPTPYYWGYGQYLQDSKTWAQKNLLDNIVPQLYQYNITDYNYALNQTWKDVGQYDPDDFFAGVLSKVGSYVVDQSLLAQMIDANRNKNVNGECFFFYEALRANGNQLAEYLKFQYYSTPALIPYRKGNVYRPKGIIVNEDSPDVIKSGNWQTYQIKGYEGGILRTGDTSTENYLEYYFEISDSAVYDVFAFRTPNTPWTKNANYTLYTNGREKNIIVDQSNLKEKGWYKFGSVQALPGKTKVLRIDNKMLEEGKYLVSDAVMLLVNRKLSPDQVVSVKPEVVKITTDFKLDQNYPNPFNPSTTITFTIPENIRLIGNGAVKVRLSIYDVLGKEVAVLINEDKQAGNYSINFNADGLSSGVYLYRLSAANYAESRKMILIR